MSNNNEVFFPKGYAVWLKRHYPNLTDRQITDFCGIGQHTLNSLLMNSNATEDNPIECGQLNIENLEECSQDNQKKLRNLSPVGHYEKANAKRFIGSLQKQNKLNAIVWVFHNKIDVDLTKMNKIFRSRITYLEKIKKQVIEKNLPDHINPISPVEVDFCDLQELNQILQ